MIQRHRILYMLCCALAAGMVCTIANAQAPEKSRNMELLAHVNPVDTAGLHSSVWGYTAPNGREYAFFGSQIGTHIYDITELPIKEIAYIWGPRTSWRNIKTYKHYAYVSCEFRDSGAGLQILDLSRLPQSVELLRTDTTEFLGAHTLYLDGHYLYVNGTRSEGKANGGAVIMDLEPDPVHPVRAGQVDPYYYHDSFVRNDTLLGAALGEGADIYDISDKANPVRLANIRYPYSGTHNIEFLADGNYIVTSDEVGFTPKTMKVWDIRDMENIRLVAEYSPNLLEVIHNVRVIGRYAYVAWYTAGVRIIDMIDPLHPREVAFYDTYDGTDGGFNGVWEVYARFPSGKVIASDRNSGLYVFQFNGATATSVSGVVRDSKTGDPLPGARIYISPEREPIITDAAGRYYVGGVQGDDVDLSVSLFGYNSEMLQVTMDSDLERDILLDPSTMFTVSLQAKYPDGSPVRDFAYAIDPYIEPTHADGETAVVTLPKDSTYTFIFGEWGYGIERRVVTVTNEGEEVMANFQRHYQDDATLELGWSYEDSADDALTGRWVRTRPYLGYPNSGWIHPPTEPAGGGGPIFLTGLPVKDSPPEVADVNAGSTTLTSPLMDLSDHVDPAMFFDLWFVHYERDSVVDAFITELSNDGGNTWAEVCRETKGRAGWKRHAIFPRDILPITDRMRIRFRAADTLGGALVVAGIDNFDVYNRLFSDVPSETGESTEEMLMVRTYPNPISAEGTITIGVSHAVAGGRILLYSAQGKQVALLYQGEIEPGDHEYALPDSLPVGWYLVRVTGAGGAVADTDIRVVR